MLRKSRTWTLLTLLALLGVVSAPALAFNCCCTSLVRSVEKSPAAESGLVAAKSAQPAPAANQVQTPALPSCHSQPGGKQAADSSSAVSQAVSAQGAPPAASQPSGNCHTAQSPTSSSISKAEQVSLFSAEVTCHCPQQEVPSVAETESAAAFSSLGLFALLPIAQWVPTAPNTLSLLLRGPISSRPRAPSFAPHSGRAPPIYLA